MNYTLHIVQSTIYYFCLLLYFTLQQSPVELEPVDAGVEDTSAISESLQVAQPDLKEDQSFEKLFRVKGSPEIYVRRAGALHAVFRDPLYAEIFSGTLPLIPTGTVYCIGEVTQQSLNQLGQIAKVVQEDDSEMNNQQNEKWNPVSPGVSHTPIRSIRFIDDEQYRRARLVSFVLEIQFRN